MCISVETSTRFENLEVNFGERASQNHLAKLFCSMDVLGNALTLYDLGLRIAAFINDLRYAQDDFISLRSEAECLRVSLNSLCAESCQDTIYLYLSSKQKGDLELILENTLLSMEDLNRSVTPSSSFV